MSRELAKKVATDITYHYFNSENGGVVTIAVGKGQEKAYFGTAFCSPEDQFVKATGRLTALRRLITSVHQNNGIEVKITNRIPTRHPAASKWLTMCPKPSWAQKEEFTPRFSKK